MKGFRIALGLLMLGALSITGCVKQKFDTPPDQGSIDPNLPVNMTIAQLSAMAAGRPVQITNDSTIAGIVTADDRTGNFYKEIVIQDSTGGIVLSLNQTDLYSSYPIGRKVYVKLKGLYVGTYTGIPQVGYTLDATGALVSIPSTLLPTYIIQATYPNVVAPIDVTIAQVNANPNMYLNRLVRLDSVEFQNTYVNRPYAQPSTLASGTSITLEDCSGGTMVMYNSGYATFQAYLTPGGKGTVTGIYSTYNGSSQFLIRDTTDVILHNARCDGSNPSGTAAIVSIDSIRNIYNSVGATKLGSYTIKGVVILSADSSNETAATVVIQDGNRGISLYYGSNPYYHYGDSLVVTVTGDSLIQYKGSLEIKASTSNTTVAATGRSVTPQQLTVNQINTQYASLGLEYTLISITNATVSGGGTYSGDKDLTDGTGTIELYTSTSATFAGQAVPTTPKTFTAVVSAYNGTLELQLRAPSIDVH